jgi:hypothetical protein
MDNFPFSSFVYTLHLFFVKLHSRLLSEEQSDVYFLSREGYVLKKLFEIFLKINNEKAIKCHYFHVSRRATFGASFAQFESLKIYKDFQQYKSCSLLDFVMSFGFSEPEAVTLLAQDIGLKDYRIVFDDLFITDLYKKFTSSNACLNFTKKLKEQNQAFIKYVQSVVLDLESPIFLVDVGWKGSIQDNIFRAFDQKIQLHGLYCGLVEPGLFCSADSKKTGLLFEYSNKSIDYYIYNEARPIFEVLLPANHCSIKRYCDLSNENEKKYFELDHNEKELDLYNKIQINQEKKIIQFYETIASQLSGMNEVELSAIVRRRHKKLVLYPSRADLAYYESLYHYENFGVFKFNHHSSGDFSSIAGLKKFIKSPRTILLSYIWPIYSLYANNIFFLGFLYRIYFYFKILKNLLLDDQFKQLKKYNKEQSRGIEIQEKMMKEREDYISILKSKINSP